MVYNGGVNLTEAKCSFCGASLLRYQVSKVFFCNIDCKSSYQRLAKPVSKEWLIEHYVSKGMNCSQIAVLVGRDPKSVWNWLKDFGIETRKRGKTDNWKYSIGVPRVLTEDGRRKLSEAAQAARARDGRVPYLKNGVHHLKGKRGAETTNWKGGITPERQLFYTTEEWKRCAGKVWRRDNGQCRRCGLDARGMKRNEKARMFALHHIDGFKIKKRRADSTNIVLLCRVCHLWIHSKANKKGVFLGKGHRYSGKSRR